MKMNFDYPPQKNNKNDENLKEKSILEKIRYVSSKKLIQALAFSTLMFSATSAFSKNTPDGGDPKKVPTQKKEGEKKGEKEKKKDDKKTKTEESPTPSDSITYAEAQKYANTIDTSSYNYEENVIEDQKKKIKEGAFMGEDAVVGKKTHMLNVNMDFMSDMTKQVKKTISTMPKKVESRFSSSSYSNSSLFTFDLGVEGNYYSKYRMPGMGIYSGLSFNIDSKAKSRLFLEGSMSAHGSKEDPVAGYFKAGFGYNFGKYGESIHGIYPYIGLNVASSYLSKEGEKIKGLSFSKKVLGIKYSYKDNWHLNFSIDQQKNFNIAYGKKFKLGGRRYR